MSNSHLIVGLGGNGGKIIRELRKIVASGRDQSAGANFEYLYLDTSDDELSKTEEWKVLGSDVSLENSQFLTFAASGIRPVLQDPGAFPGLADWIEPREVFGFVNATTAGAAQKRKLGRLVFAQNASLFVDALVKRVKTLESRAPEAGAVIHVVCGLAGGTGSGSVVDVVAQIRQKFPKPSQYRILVYAILPEDNASRLKAKGSDGASNYYGNAYAALSELNALAVGRYKPVNVLDGGRMDHDIYFNGCYLVHNLNENNVPFEVDREVPRVVADFIYQKCLNPEWEGLNRAEKGENDSKNFEVEADHVKARAKLFMSFGIERVVVPEEEIKEFMAYEFAEQATRQLIFNNFQQGEGFVDEAVQKDWRSEVRKDSVAQAMLISDAHLTLEAGILEDDQKNPAWKSIVDYWKQVVARFALEVQGDKSIEQTAWASTLRSKLAKVYDETYRMMGVSKFYDLKAKARLEMARHVALKVERELFTQWHAGDTSLLQQQKFLGAMLEWLAERQVMFNDAVGKSGNDLQRVNQRLDELTKKFNDVGTLKQLLTDRRESLFADIATAMQELFVILTKREAHRFAATMIPFVKDEVTQLLGNIELMHQRIAQATETIVKGRSAQLGEADSVYQKRLFDRAAIDKVMKSIVTDAASQQARTQRVRRTIVELAGTDTDSFSRLASRVTVTSLLSALSRESADIVESAHAALPKDMQRVLNVNIVDRLALRYDGNPEGLRDFVSRLYKDAGCMLRIDASEASRVVEGNAGGSTGAMQTIGVFLPQCDTHAEFRDQLAAQFAKQQPPTGETKIQVGRFSNQVAVIKVSSLMPLRFVEGLPELRRNYDGLRRDRMETFLLHSEGDGSKLPSLYARTAEEARRAALNQPNLVAARLLNLVKQRENKTTGVKEWVFVRMVDDLPEVVVLPGKQWGEVLQADHPDSVRTAISTAVKQKIGSEYVHMDRKRELEGAFKSMLVARFQEAGEDDQDPEFVAMKKMRDLVVKNIVGLQ